MSYEPIENHGVIGDMHSVALVSMQGVIDWCCLPRFDSPSIFASILDDRKGGFCGLSTVGESRARQMYLPESNVLLTRFLSERGVGEVMDFMPVSSASGGAYEAEARQIVRIAKSVRGTADFHFVCKPAFDYGRGEHRLSIKATGAVFQYGDQRLTVSGSFEITACDGGVECRFTLQPNETAQFLLRFEASPAPGAAAVFDAAKLLDSTLSFWRSWVSQCSYTGRWREMVTRSALLLKLLTYQPTGAIVAAPTTSLPEAVGGPRNWDYRYTWVRDAAFSVYALLRLGFTEEAEAFAGFIKQRVEEADPNAEGGPLNVLYSIDGRGPTEEMTLDHFDGYRGSKPVRIGNAAVEHLQLDIYGELLDSLYIYDRHGSPISYDMWLQIVHMLNWVLKNWQRDDRSIWEVRGGMKQFTYSKLQCWVALDRGLRIARQRSFPTDLLVWVTERDKIYRSIMDDAWSKDRRAFTQYFGAETMDASVLLLPLMKFVGPKDPRMLATLQAVENDLVSDSLVARYQIGKAADDGLPGEEGTFTVCSFWYVECLARAGQLDKARFLFEKMLTYANHLGLYAEEIGQEGEALGNFPQAFTHLGLISAAVNLNRLLDGA